MESIRQSRWGGRKTPISCSISSNPTTQPRPGSWRINWKINLQDKDGDLPTGGRSLCEDVPGRNPSDETERRQDCGARGVDATLSSEHDTETLPAALTCGLLRDYNS